MNNIGKNPERRVVGLVMSQKKTAGGKPFLLSALFILISASLDTDAVTWLTYQNDQTGATADIPVNWIKISPPESIDGGDLFSSPDYHASILIRGFRGQSSLLNDAAKVTDDGESITYEKRQPHSVVVSGTKGDQIFYRKLVSICHDTTWSELLIKYPITEKLKYDSLVVHVSKSLSKQQCGHTKN
jgi:serine/threonine-protein kinase